MERGERGRVLRYEVRDYERGKRCYGGMKGWGRVVGEEEVEGVVGMGIMTMTPMNRHRRTAESERRWI
jgi:hypothetical protein